MLVTEESLVRGLRLLVRRDPDLAKVINDWGSPPIWARPPGFATLLLIILEQQVSLASARAAFTRLQVTIGP
ncbi:MAG TPA: DNA-3-methyladenine glycosylase 2 family protein, partial [Candidatus Methylomirabilis sp.]